MLHFIYIFPTPSTQSISFNGQYLNTTLSSKNSTIMFNVPNGTYTYSIHLPAGYTSSSNTKGSVSISGSPYSVPPIKVQVTINYLLIGIIIVIVVIIAVVAGIFVMRRGKKKGGPKEWQEPPKEKPEEENKWGCEYWWKFNE